MKKNDCSTVTVISDLHLGTKQCKDEQLLSFLKGLETDHLILNGDIIDFWAWKRSYYWNKTQTKIVRQLLKMSEKIKVTYVTGNHDGGIRHFLDHLDTPFFGNIELTNELSIDRSFICHGDRFDYSMHVPSFFHGRLDSFLELFPERVTSWLTKKLERFMSTERRARKFIKKHPTCSTIVIGHTHLEKNADGIYVNSGSWTNAERLSYLTYSTTKQQWKLNYYDHQ